MSDFISECAGCGNIMPYNLELYAEGETGECFCDECKVEGCDVCE